MAWHLKRACRWASMRGLHHICSIFSQIKRSHRHIKYGETIDTHWRKVIANYAQSCTIVFFSCRPFRPRPGHGHGHIHPATATRPPGDGHPATATRPRPHGHTAPHGATRRHTAPHGATRRHTAPHGATRRHTAPHGATRRHTAPHGATRRHTAPHGATRRHTAPHGHTATPHGHTATPGHPAIRPAGQPATCFMRFWWNQLFWASELFSNNLRHAPAWCLVLCSFLSRAALQRALDAMRWTFSTNLQRTLPATLWTSQATGNTLLIPHFQLSPATYNTLLVLTFSGPQLSETIQKRFLGTMFPNFSSNLQALGATRLTISSSMSHALDATPLFSSNHATCSWCYFSHALNLMVVVDFDMEHA